MIDISPHVPTIARDILRSMLGMRCRPDGISARRTTGKPRCCALRALWRKQWICDGGSRTAIACRRSYDETSPAAAGQRGPRAFCGINFGGGRHEDGRRDTTY